jgi:hypothetical protein
LTTVGLAGDPDKALRASRLPRAWPRLLLAAICVAVAISVTGASPARANPPRIEDVEDHLRRDPSYKVRVNAAIVLGRLAQPRSLPALIGALKDDHPTVRASAAYALGRYQNPLAREAVNGALRDNSPIVRHMAREALRHMGGGPDENTPRHPGEPGIRGRVVQKPSFEIKPVGDPGQRAGPALRSHMRDFLVDQLRPYGDVMPAERSGTYAIDGVIKSVTMTSTAQDVEVNCAVQLVVSRQPAGGVFMMTSRDATVQRPKRQWRPEQRSGMEMQALEAAVRSASQDLVEKLR